MTADEMAAIIAATKQRPEESPMSSLPARIPRTVCLFLLAMVVALGAVSSARALRAEPIGSLKKP